ncbi:MAG TPA: hypothetical protein VJR94_00350, partial [Candidatus Nitrosocosmicus sp.]|nr:hypothetical protein [Candidatus Nitrosocosmicus sp.]
MSKKYQIFAKLISTFFILTMGFLSSISTPSLYAQSISLPDIPLLDYDTKSNNNLKDLYDMIPNLNKKDPSEQSSDIDVGSKDSLEEATESPDSKDENYIKG